MKRIRPDYYEKFQCIAGLCSITCCQEWKIAVDADTNRKWKKLLPPQDVTPQKKNLSAYTTNKNGGRVIELTEDHKCPFLNKNKLCKLVTAYGDKVLSQTCTVFPREVHRFSEWEEETLMPCCPAVIDLLREEEESHIRMERWTAADEYEQICVMIRNKIADFFSEDDKSVEEILLCAFYILSELYRVKEKISTEIVSEYFSDESEKQLVKAIRELASDPAATMEEQNELLQDLAVNYRKEGLYQNYLDPVIDAAEDLSEHYEDLDLPRLSDAFAVEFDRYEPLMKKFLKNEMLSDLFSPDGDIESMMVHFQWIAMEYAVIRHSIFLQWYQSGKGEIPYGLVRDYIVVICRMTGYEEEDIYEYLENSFESLIWDFGYLALIV